jgi:hypothetical protein
MIEDTALNKRKVNATVRPVRLSVDSIDYLLPPTDVLFFRSLNSNNNNIHLSYTHRKGALPLFLPPRTGPPHVFSFFLGSNKSMKTVLASRAVEIPDGGKVDEAVNDW